jgi:hypothetical protein
LPKSDEQIQQLSGEAAAVWGSPVMRDFFEIEIKRMFVNWLNEPDEAERNKIWNQAKGMDLLKARMLGFMAAGRAVERKKDGSIADGIGAII